MSDRATMFQMADELRNMLKEYHADPNAEHLESAQMLKRLGWDEDCNLLLDIAMDLLFTPHDEFILKILSSMITLNEIRECIALYDHKKKELGI